MSAAPATMPSFIAKVVIGVAFLSTSASADPIPRIGVLVPMPANSLYEVGLRDGLRELGYIEGKNIVIEWRRTGGANIELRSLTRDLARSKPDVIVVFTTPAGRAAVETTTTIPIVFLSGDPVAAGLAASLARPGRNATGVSGLLTELTAKRLELLQQVVPRARRIVCLMNSSNPSGVQQLEVAQSAAKTLDMQLVTLDARNEIELDAALHALPQSAADGVLVGADVLFRANKAKIAQAVRKARLPGTFPYRDYHEDGVLMSYGPDTKEIGRKVAVYVDKILKGAKPANLPIEQISTYELIINLRVARELGINVPQELLLRADEVIR